MDEDTKQMMREQLAISRESLVLLKRMNRDVVYRKIFAAFKYLIIVALMVFSYVQIQPYFQNLLALGSGDDVQKAIQQYFDSAKN